MNTEYILEDSNEKDKIFLDVYDIYKKVVKKINEKKGKWNILSKKAKGKSIVKDVNNEYLYIFWYSFFLFSPAYLGKISYKVL